MSRSRLVQKCRINVDEIRSKGISWVAYVDILYVRNMIAQFLLKNWRKPSVGELQTIGQILNSSDDLLQALFGEGCKSVLKEISLEYEQVQRELLKRYEKLQFSYPANYAIEESTSFLIYAVSRLVKPSVILETGVANGHSSFIMLSALNRNNHGLLYSVDISKTAGCLVREEERFRWRLEFLDIWRPKSSFKKLLDRIDGIDMFIHDSDHSFSWQNFEYQSVLRKMNQHGVFSSDDVDASFAFLRLCSEVGIKAHFLYDKRKTFGCFCVDHENSSRIEGKK